MNTEDSPQPSTQYTNTSSARRSMFEGRINRLAFFKGHVVLFGAPIVILLVYTLLNFILVSFGGTNQESSPLRSLMNISVFLFGAAYIVFVLFALFSLYIRRLHDMNLTGWLSVLLLISPASLILYVVLQAVEGTPGPNKYGAQEEPRKLAAILGWRR